VLNGLIHVCVWLVGWAQTVSRLSKGTLKTKGFVDVKYYKDVLRKHRSQSEGMIRVTFLANLDRLGKPSPQRFCFRNSRKF
jgi:hypothetical protein